ncbi:MAG: PhzF family phenazine biosynthesis protein [Marinoscillum sp.]
MNQAPYYLLDVFTEVKYGGNQLAIFPNADQIDENLFQKIARELNLSETVFLFPPDESGNYSMRIFTPGKELPTAGHPTVGTAHYLAGILDHQPTGTMKISLQQKVGLINVYVEMKDNQPGIITMHQPLPVFGPMHNDKREELSIILGLSIDDIADAPIQEVSCGNNTLLVPVKSTDSLKNIRLKADIWANFKAKVGNALMYPYTLEGVQGGNVQGRMFAPELGITEDPATGSANGPLAAYLTKHKLIKMPAVSLQGYEMGRPSQIHLDTETDSDGNITAVKVSGKSVFTGEGVHFVDPV